MADHCLSVRLARFQLAQCLLAEGRSAEALEQMRRVLKDPGADPRESMVYAALSELHAARNELVSALESSVLAVSGDPDPVNGVRRALTLIEQHPQAASDLPEDAIQTLEASLRSETHVPATRSLLGELRLQRGEYDKALEAFHGVPTDQSCSTLMKIAEVNLVVGKAEEARRTLQKAAPRQGRGADEEDRFRLLLSRAEVETGHYSEALVTLPEGQTPAHCFIRALASVGQGLYEEALRQCETQTSLDGLLLRAVIYLHGEDFEKARSEGLAATSHNPSSPDVLLVRAQVELESAANLDEGRGLLERAFEITRQDLTNARWLTLQKPFAQDRATYQYFVVEAADVSRASETLALAETVDREGITYSQEGRLNTIRGNCLRDLAMTDSAAEAFEQASINFEEGGLISSAVSGARHAFELTRSGTRAARLVELLWRESFSQASIEEHLRFVDEASSVVTAEDLERESIEDTDSLVYSSGLLALRKMELIERDQLPTGWSAVVALMTSVLNSPHDPYRLRFLADALGAVAALGAATIFADRAFAENEDDEMRETAVIARANYYCGLSHVQTLLDGFVDSERYSGWSETVRVGVKLDSGEHADLADFRRHILVDRPWARVIEAKSVALVDGARKAMPLFARVAEELADMRGEEHSAAQAWLEAGQLKKARRVLEEGTKRHNVNPRHGAWVRALSKLVSGELEHVATALQSLDDLTPIQVSEAFYVTLPILRDVYGDPSVSNGLDKLAERVGFMVAGPWRNPTSQDGLEDAPDELRPLLLAMAQLIERADTDPDITDAVRRLTALGPGPGGRLERVIKHASYGLLASGDAEPRTSDDPESRAG